MKLRILGWQSEGLRCANTSLKFNAEDKVDFIQMNNGEGKTTTLNLLRMALTGEKNLPLIDEKSKGEDPLECAHGLIGEENSHGKFTLNTSINDENYSLIINISRLESLESSIEFETTSVSLGGKNSGWCPPVEAQPFLTNDFVQLYIFDGERQRRIFDKGDAYAKKTIKTLCQFNILEEASQYVKDYVDQESENVGKGDRGRLTQLINLKNTAAKYLKTAKDARMTLSNLINSDEEEYNGLKKDVDTYLTRDNEDRTKVKEFTEKIHQTKSDIENTQKNIFLNIINVSNLSNFTRESLKNFKDCLSLLKLPGNVSRQFFTELSESDKCVCQRSIGPEEKNNIINNAENYLDDDITGVLNSMKQHIESNSSSSDEITSEIDKLKNLDKTASETETAFTRFKNGVTSGAKKEQDKVARCGKLEESLKQRKLLLREYDDPMDSHVVKKNNITTKIKNINTLEAVLKNREKEVDKYNDAVELRDNYKKFNTIILDTINESSQIIFKGMVTKVQSKVDQVMGDESPPIIIEDIDDYVKLNKRDGLSSGQALSTAYSFISAALEYSNIAVPFVVDSPTGSLDNLKRTGIGNILPKVTSQCMLFITPTEKDNFVDAIKKAADDKCSYTTIFHLNEIHRKWIDEREFMDNELKYHDNNKCAVLHGEKLMHEYGFKNESGVD